MEKPKSNHEQLSLGQYRSAWRGDMMRIGNMHTGEKLFPISISYWQRETRQNTNTPDTRRKEKTRERERKKRRLSTQYTGWANLQIAFCPSARVQHAIRIFFLCVLVLFAHWLFGQCSFIWHVVNQCYPNGDSSLTIVCCSFLLEPSTYRFHGNGFSCNSRFFLLVVCDCCWWLMSLP